MPEYTAYVRDELAKLTVERVNEVVRTHISPDNLQVVMISANAAALREELLSARPSTIGYDGEKPAELLAEDEVVGRYPLQLTPQRVRITPVSEVFR